MKSFKKVLALVLCVVVAATLFVGCGKKSEGGQEAYDLTFTVFSASNTAYAKALDNWAAELNEESNGRLNIKIVYGGTIAGPTDSVEVTAQGGADICWSTVPLNASKFNLINLFATYGEKITNSLSATDALVNLYKNNADIKKEFDSMGLHILGVHALTPNNLGSKGTKYEKVADFNGASVMAISTTNVAVLSALGASPLGISTNDLYENFSKNVSKAAVVDASLYESTSTYEVIDHLMTYNWATCVSFIGMNQAKYDSLPADLQKMLDDKFDDLSYDAAEKVNVGYQEFVKVLADSGIDTYEISDEVKLKLEELLIGEVEGAWNTYCSDNGIDAAAIKADMDKYIEQGAEKYGAKYDWYAE